MASGLCCGLVSAIVPPNAGFLGDRPSAIEPLIPHRVRRGLVPPGLHPVGQQAQPPAATPDPPAPRPPQLVLDGDVVDRLSLRGGPEEGAAEEVPILGADDPVAVPLGPSFEQRPRT